ncbi:Z-ring formation inhibitor MciZ [Peribacillus cavernae]|uniref:Z-ring formation inhibitor MciZ n=2 Tax=Peribacillus cavernae TaxID=1674310 RepID=A0A3S0TRW6_9BACI|nr:Z-ring formation inhibitor MciZ [Peribacillus cavernae]RUQ26535.1 Z-ring formation inhibitor MciZ [Peribacillus cavernae]
MKIYVLDKGVVLAGKGWEIKQKLKEYQDRYVYVNDWIQDVQGQGSLPALKRVK